MGLMVRVSSGLPGRLVENIVGNLLSAAVIISALLILEGTEALWLVFSAILFQMLFVVWIAWWALIMMRPSLERLEKRVDSKMLAFVIPVTLGLLVVTGVVLSIAMLATLQSD